MLLTSIFFPTWQDDRDDVFVSEIHSARSVSWQLTYRQVTKNEIVLCVARIMNVLICMF